MIPATLWLRGFALTIATEEIIAVPLLRTVEPSVARRMGAVLIANLATHPLVWFFFPHLGWSWTWVTIVAESWAFGFEVFVYALIFPRARFGRAVLVSGCANFASYVLGLVVVPLGFFR
jgi:hypothetical protein